MDEIRPLSRRCFMRLLAVTAAAWTLPACRGGTAEGSADYYRQHKDDILSEARASLSALQTVLAEKFGQTLASQVLAETRTRYAALLPDLPYIGGDRNELTANLCQGALGLAFYQVMQTHEKGADAAGEVLYRAAELWVRSIPLTGYSARAANSEGALQARQRSAERSQLREYPGDWVAEYVSGEGQAFDWGIDYTECGLCKLFSAYGAETFTPYLCLLDFPMSRAMHTGLQRTTTLALGGERCDFRYTAGGEIHMEWIPPFMAAATET